SLGGRREGPPPPPGGRDGHTRDSPKPPPAMEGGVALGLDGGGGIGAGRQAYGKSTLGGCLGPRGGRIPLGPRTRCGLQAGEAGGQQPGRLPLWREKPGRTRQEPPRRWYGHSVVRRVEVAYADRRLEMAALRLLGVHSSQLAHPAAVTYAAAQAKEAAQVAEH